MGRRQPEPICKKMKLVNSVDDPMWDSIMKKIYQVEDVEKQVEYTTLFSELLKVAIVQEDSCLLQYRQLEEILVKLTNLAKQDNDSSVVAAATCVNTDDIERQRDVVRTLQFLALDKQLDFQRTNSNCQ